MMEAALDGAARLGATRGPIVATALLLGPPMIVLGSVSPFVVKLEVGSRSASRPGASSPSPPPGSLAGTFVTAFWWIPDYGCRHTLRILFATLVALGVAGLAWPASRAGRAALALALAGLPFLAPDPPLGSGVVFAGESPYNTVLVEDEGGDRLLCLNDPREGSHSVRLGSDVLTGGYYDNLYSGRSSQGGGGSSSWGWAAGRPSRSNRRLYPGARVTAVEIDPLVVRVAHEYLGLERGPDLDVHVEDARPFLRRRSDLFDVIEVDVFAGGPYAPFYCLTAEFFGEVRARLAPAGLLSMNVYAPGGDRTLAEAVIATLAEVFPAVFELQREEERVLFAFREPTSPDNVRELLESPAVPDEIHPVARETAAALRTAVPGGGIVLTDDRAPVEPLTHRMIVRRDLLRAKSGRS